ncbi:hypothetical protein CFAM422_000178 [Trichoderma lentiforme]|uniref:Nucleoside phosphorylase domain-containing protein n=1 Tax=Trichoderma lentiforme TaxID=1567552 RepID=A0A9P5CGL5_9HYPO|nr:hypothetical protein CFAM422_000178 [Trichoderma lentiforme]
MPNPPAKRLHSNLIRPSIPVKHPSIVILGAILLEIYLGQRLESFLGLDYEITDDHDLYLNAWKAYYKVRRDTIPTQYNEAILACLDASIFGKLEDNDEEMRSAVFRRIIKPLDEIMFEMFSERDLLKLDKAIAEKYNLASGLSLPLPTLLSTKTSFKQCIPGFQNPVYTANRNQGGNTSKEYPAVDGTVASTQLRIDRGSNKTILQEPQYNPTTQTAGSSRIKQSDFKVAIVCALTIEADAVFALFDSCLNEDDVEFNEMICDPNVYSTGKIGRHYVVLLHMANMGKANAATVTTNCSRTFPNIKLALVVGICGAVPHSIEGTDIMLGDVIISEGVFQYDLGRQFPQEFRPKIGTPDSLSRPNGNIRAALSKWKGDAWRRQLHSSMHEYLRSLQATSKLSVQYPGALKDKLFEANYPHIDDGVPCDHGCDGLRVQRRRSESSMIQPKIHFGIVASGDSVMKSGEERDRIAQEHGIIAFEMESAGVWDVFPCIVVKGACDYADSHKNKAWQGYAAATAAACMKAVLNDQALSI